MKKSHFLIIVGLFLLYAINNYFWLLQNKLFVAYDQGIHLWTSLRFLRAFIHPERNIFYALSHANTTHWPSLFHFTASIFNLIFGTSYVVSVMTNMLFFLLLMVSLYLIGKKISNSSTGILAVSILSFYPIIYGHSRLFLLDLPLASIVTFSIYCLISTDRFKNLKWSVIFGISAGLGMLVKWSYLLFVLPLFLYEFIAYIREFKNKDFLRRTKNLSLYVSTAFVVASLWYVGQPEQVRRTMVFLSRAIKKFPHHSLLEEIEWIILTFSNNMLSGLFFVLFIICLAVFYIKKNLRHKLFLTIWYLIPLLLLSSVVWQQSRYLIPVLPCLALITAISINSLKKQKLKGIILAFIFTIGLVQYFNVSFNHNIERRENLFGSKLKDFNVMYKPYPSDAYALLDVGPPCIKDWKHEYIARSLGDYVQRLKIYHFVMGIIYDESGRGFTDLFGRYIMNYYLVKELIMADLSFLDGEIALTLNDFHDTASFIETIPMMQCILYISKDNRWPTFTEIEKFFLSSTLKRNQPMLKAFLKEHGLKDHRLLGLIDSRDKFSLIDRFELPYNYYANVYLKKVKE